MDARLPNLSRNIARLREEAKLTQKQLAEASACSSIAMIECGERRSPRTETLEGIAKALSRRLGRTITVADLHRDPPASAAKRKAV